MKQTETSIFPDLARKVRLLFSVTKCDQRNCESKFIQRHSGSVGFATEALAGAILQTYSPVLQLAWDSKSQKMILDKQSISTAALITDSGPLSVPICTQTRLPCRRIFAFDPSQGKKN